MRPSKAALYMGYRRRARECALQLLYQYDMTHDGVQEILARYWEMQEPQPQQTRDKAAAYFQAALQRRDEIDRPDSRAFA